MVGSAAPKTPHRTRGQGRTGAQFRVKNGVKIAKLTLRRYCSPKLKAHQADRKRRIENNFRY